MSILPASELAAEAHVRVLIIGAGACGLVAGLAARGLGAEVMLLERDALPRGSTALSSGLIPAAGTRVQARQGIADSAAALAADILRKNHGRSDPDVTRAVAAASGGTIDWLMERHGLDLSVVEGFLYPGHATARMHGTPRRDGAELMDQLMAAGAAAGLDIVTQALATTLYADEAGRVAGVGLARPDGSRDAIGCDALVLACNGYGGAGDLLRAHIPQMAGALYSGHAGNQGDALRWGTALGAEARDLGAYQGHGSVAQPHGILVTWAVIMEGGIQVNLAGRRFSNEAAGYSEQAMPVLAQPGRVAFSIFGARQHAVAMQFEDFRQAEALGAIRRAESAAGLAALLGIDAAGLAATLDLYRRQPDGFGRDFSEAPDLGTPLYGVRVTGSLFHTQGGLSVDVSGRVRRADGTALPNLFAAGGAARGLSGPEVGGYLSGNGLLSAVVLGRIAGEAAARGSQG